MEVFEAKAYVYVIQASISKKVKIGWAVDPDKRLKMLQTGNPEPLTILLKIRCRTDEEAKQKEAELHEKFGHIRLQGEWFDFGPDIINLLFERGVLFPEKAEEYYYRGKESERNFIYKFVLSTLFESMERAESIGVPVWYMARLYRDNENLQDLIAAIDQAAKETHLLNTTGSIWGPIYAEKNV